MTETISSTRLPVLRPAAELAVSLEKYPLLQQLRSSDGHHRITELLHEVVEKQIKYIAICGTPGSGKTTAKNSLALWLKENIPDKKLVFLSYDTILAELVREYDMPDSRWPMERWQMVWHRFSKRLRDLETQLRADQQPYIVLIETPGIGLKQRGWQFIEQLAIMHRQQLCVLAFVANPIIQYRAANQRMKAVVAKPDQIDEFVEFMKKEGHDISADLAARDSKEESFELLIQTFLHMANKGFIDELWKEQLDQAKTWFFQYLEIPEKRDRMFQYIRSIKLSDQVQSRTDRRDIRLAMAFWAFRLHEVLKLTHTQAHAVFAEFYPDLISVPILPDKLIDQDEK